MSSAISRAREQAMTGGGGDYLDNDTLITEQQVFAIIDVQEDRGGGFAGQDRWIVKVEPFFEDQGDPEGLITLTDNPARRKFMQVLINELNELEKKGGDVFIGPCCLVRLKGKSYRYIEIVEWDDDKKAPILPNGAVLAGARVEEDLRPARPRSRAGASSPEPLTSSTSAEAAPRSFVEADAGKTEPVSAATAPSAEFPPIKEWAKRHGYDVPVGRGRVKAEVKAAYEKAKAGASYDDEEVVVQLDQARPSRYQGTADEVEAGLEETATEIAQKPEAPRTRPAQVPVGAPSRAVSPPVSGAQTAREQVWQPGMAGVSVESCPDCGKHIHDRIFPTGDGGYALIHAQCENGGEQRVMPATPEVAEG